MNDVDDAVTCNRYEYLTSSSKLDVECLGILIARVGPVLVVCRYSLRQHLENTNLWRYMHDACIIQAIFSIVMTRPQ